jgi:bifunctional DNA-binding transcriptional regulator/antitoxin component of YhaV-PrlF toxin-antitoxin module
MIDKPHITQTAAQTTAIIRLTIPKEIRKVMGSAIGAVLAAVTAQG